ncbi:hypothetical protein LTR08_001812 [Meristemomyces frigidus]|nr:hypothetical protein LTR08_001812 [Meristemomyces frigidus]
MALMAASAIADLTVGNAVVINTCDYEVYMANTPSDDGVHKTQTMTMQPNAMYSQTWTELTNGAGWSIKLSKSATEWTSDIMQYEYTFHDDGLIWYDLSDVNGNPWDADWEITASSNSSTCSPLQQAYRYATDDAYGMQACPQDSVITVTLCSGEDGTAASNSSSVAAETSSTAAATAYSDDASTMAASTTAMPTTAASTTAESSVAQETSTPVETTTFATSTLATSSAVTTDSDGATTTEVATAVITDVVTSTHWHHWNTARHVASRRHVHG